MAFIETTQTPATAKNKKSHTGSGFSK